MTPAETRFTRLADSAGARVLGYLIRRVDPVSDAADLLADVLATAWRRIDDLPEDDATASAWLFGIARGVLANHRRGQARRLALADRLREHLAARPPASPEPSVEAIHLREALARLPSQDRELLMLVGWEGLTAEEIAVLLQITPAAVRQRLVRARSRLRVALDSCQNDENPEVLVRPR
ncbi:MAG TPA: sigma-70 family RNA polymerase sigma factor [Micromonosporaceae bacterium]|nr:sigma-70 family RNA polymerase sigma factor [Micromonosporaceae bacterium]